MNFHAGEVPPKEGMTRWMGALYAEAIKRLDENPDLEEQVRALFMRWDARDPEIVASVGKDTQMVDGCFQAGLRFAGYSL